MSGQDPIQIRLDLARGHWALGERADALVALERAAKLEPAHAALCELVEGFLAEADPEIEPALEAVRALLPALEEAPEIGTPLATSTMAELLASQGHEARALAMCEDLLARNPADERAGALRERLGAAFREPVPEPFDAPFADVATPDEDTAPRAPEPTPSGNPRAVLAALAGWLEKIQRRADQRRGELRP